MWLDVCCDVVFGTFFLFAFLKPLRDRPGLVRRVFGHICLSGMAARLSNDLIFHKSGESRVYSGCIVVDELTSIDDV